MIITYYNNYSWQSINIPVIPWKKKHNHQNKKFLKLRKTQRIFLLTSECVAQYLHCHVRYDHKYHSSNRKGPSDLVSKQKTVHFLNRSPKNLRKTPPDRYPKEVPSRRNELPEISRCDATYFHRSTQYTGSIRLFYSEFQLKNRDFCLFILFFFYTGT